MTAYRLLGWGEAAQFDQVPVPEPSGAEVLVRVAAVGLCHTDVHLIDAAAGTFGFDVPFTLGHETTGTVAALGAGVTDLDLGTPVIASAHLWCGRCAFCLLGLDNLCLAHHGGPGYGADGGLAEYVVLPRNTLVEIGDLNPCAAAPLADAGATAYHAVQSVRSTLRPGWPVVVIGAGALGGYAIQFLGLAGACPIVAADLLPHRLAEARELGADQTVEGTDGLDDAVKAVGDGRGAAVVLDFVGSVTTAAAATRVVAAGGAVVVLGSGQGSVAVGWGRTPPECRVFTSLGNTLADLRDVVTLARAGRLRLPHEAIAFADVADGYARVKSGDGAARVVVTMP
jgi:propanol-preferring alcohol dehydrogenase